MYRLTVISNPDYAYGFRLAGANVIEARNQEEAKKFLVSAINDDESGIIAVEEDFMNEIDTVLQAKIERLYRPIVIPIPAPKKIKDSGAGRRYLSSFIKRAVGFDIKLKQG